jgi:hypothetical protein
VVLGDDHFDISAACAIAFPCAMAAGERPHALLYDANRNRGFFHHSRSCWSRRKAISKRLTFLVVSN